MFSYRQNIGGAKHWDRSFFEKFCKDLESCGFCDQKIKLPVKRNSILITDDLQLDKVEQIIKDEIQRREISVQKFLDQEYNYPAVILVAKNASTKETIKVLYVNVSNNVSFNDTTFPSGHSVPSQLFIQSPDPARLYSLFHFFIQYLRRGGSSLVWDYFLGSISIFLIPAELIAAISVKTGLIQQAFEVGPFLDIGLFIICVYFVYKWFKVPTGLSVNDRSTATTLSFINRALKGDLKDNPIVNLVISILVSVFTAIILKLLGFP